MHKYYDKLIFEQNVTKMSLLVNEHKIPVMGIEAEYRDSWSFDVACKQSTKPFTPEYTLEMSKIKVWISFSHKLNFKIIF